jgi:hypothetical protein
MKVFRSDGKLKVDAAVITGAQPIAVSAGTQSMSTGTVVFSNSNNISFGMTNNSIVTASYSANVSAFATSNTTQSSTGVLSTNSMIFAGAGNVSVGISNGSVVISGGGGGGNLTAFATSNTTQSSTGVLSTNSLIFAGAGGVSIGISNGSVVISGGAGGGANFSGGVSTLGNTAGSTGITGSQMVLAGIGAMSLSQATGANGGTVSILGPATSSLSATGGVSIVAAGNTISIGMPPFGISAGTQSVSTGTMIFANSNSITFGMSGSSQITASFSTLPETPFGVSAGTQSVSTGTLVFSNSNNITFGMSGSSRITASFSTLPETPFGVSAGTQSVSTGTLVFSNSNNITFGMSGSSRITASFSTLPETPFGISAGTQSVSTGTLVFSNSNNFTFGMSGSSQITASYTTPVVSNAIASVGSATGSGTATSQFAAHDHIHAGVFSMGVSTGGNTLGTTRVDVGQFVFHGTNNITISQLTAAGGLNTIMISGGAGAAGNTGSISAGTTRGTLGEIVFSNSNNVSFGINGQTLTATITVPPETPFGVSAGTQSVSTGTLVFSNSNNFTFGMSGSSRVTVSYTTPVVSNAIASVGSATNSGTATSQFAAHDHIHAGVFSMGVSTGGNTAGTTRVDVGQFVFHGTNNITVSQLTAAGGLNTIMISGGAGGGGNFSAGISTQGNTAGTTGFVGSQIQFAGSGPISLSQSVNGASATLSINGPATSSISGTGQVSISVNGSTISIGVPLSDSLYSFMPWMPSGGNTATQTLGTDTSGSIFLFPFFVPAPVTASMLNIYGNMTFVTVGTSSGRMSLSFFHAIYSQRTGANSSQLSLYTSHSFSMGVTGNNSTYTVNQPTSSNSAGYTTGSISSSNTSISASYTGNKIIQIPMGTNLTPGHYWLAALHLKSSSSAAVGFSWSYNGQSVSTSAASGWAPIGSLSSAYSTGTVQFLRQGGGLLAFHGSFSSAGLNSLPGSIAMSAITGNGTHFLPHMLFWADKT